MVKRINAYSLSAQLFLGAVLSVLAAVLAVGYFGSRKIKALKKGLSPIALIGISACLGVLFFGF